MFAFAVYDFKKDVVTLARDISGEKPLYLYFHEKGFIFSSDLNSPSHLGMPSKEIDQTAINQLLKFNYIPAPLCIYKSTFKLPAASCMSIDLKKFQNTRFSCNNNSVLNFMDFKPCLASNIKTYHGSEKVHKGSPTNPSQSHPPMSFVRESLEDHT